jgi:hypothetical protein
VFYGGGVGFDGAEDTGGAGDGGVEKVFFGVGYVEVELWVWLTFFLLMFGLNLVSDIEMRGNIEG